MLAGGRAVGWIDQFMRTTNFSVTELADVLDRTGWAVLPGRADQLEAVGFALGVPVASRFGGSLIDVLEPRSPSNAAPRSLSANYGLGDFPFHIDGAHWRVPPRYLLLTCAASSDPTCSTLLWKWRSGIAEAGLRLFEDALYRVRDSSRSFYAHAFPGNRSFLRADPGCMVPMNTSATICTGIVAKLAGTACTEILWKPGDLVVVDNWTTLHARRRAKGDGTRRLCRMLVKENSHGCF